MGALVGETTRMPTLKAKQKRAGRVDGAKNPKSFYLVAVLAANASHVKGAEKLEEVGM